jgi:hypothetical protein
MATHPGPSLADRAQPVPGAGRRAGISRPRVVVVCSGVEMTELLNDILIDHYDVIPQAHPTTITAIDSDQPDVVIVGTSDGGLAPDEIVALAASHMRLRQVPFIVMSFGPNLLERARRLSGHPAVRLVSLPFDADTVRSVVNSVMAPVPSSHT